MSDASKRLEKADKYLQKGKVEEALSELLAAADADPENNLVCERAADICISQNRHKDAAGLLAGLFDRLSASGEQAKALVTYKKLARISTPRVEQTFRFAQYLEKSNKKEAAELFQKAAEGFVAAGQKNDAPELVQQVYARALLVQRRPKDAEPIIRRLYEKDHKKSLDVALLIGGLLDAGDYRRALEIARQTSDLEDKAGRNRDFVGM